MGFDVVEVVVGVACVLGVWCGGGGALACGTNLLGRRQRRGPRGLRRGFEAEPDEEDAIDDEGGGHGLRGCQARWWEENYTRRGKVGSDGGGGTSGQGGPTQKVSPMNRPIGAILDYVSDGWPCVETTTAATVAASQPVRAARQLK